MVQYRRVDDRQGAIQAGWITGMVQYRRVDHRHGAIQAGWITDRV